MPKGRRSLNCTEGVTRHLSIESLIDDDPSNETPLIALAMVAVVAALGFWVSQVLHDAGRTEDCLIQGRRKLSRRWDATLRRSGGTSRRSCWRERSRETRSLCGG